MTAPPRSALSITGRPTVGDRPWTVIRSSEGRAVVVDVVSQRENERSRIAVDGRLVADDQQCTFLVIHERTGDAWAIFPHGVGKLGVRLAKAEAVRVAQAILADARGE